MKYDLLGMAETAQLLGVTKSRLGQILNEQPDFPEPVAVLAAGRIWTRQDVEGWAVEHGRSVTPPPIDEP